MDEEKTPAGQELTEWMPDNYLTDKVKAKIRKAAFVTAQMTHGLWDWGDRKPPRHVDKTFRAPSKDVLEAAGWSRNSGEAHKYLHTKYFRECLAREEMRLDGGYKQALAELTKDGDSIKHLADLTFQRLLEDLEDPDRARKIPFREKAAFYRDLHQLGAKVKGDNDTRPKPGYAPNPAAELLDEMRGSLSEAEFKERTFTLKRRLDEKQETVDGVILASEPD